MIVQFSTKITNPNWTVVAASCLAAAAPRKLIAEESGVEGGVEKRGRLRKQVFYSYQQ